MAAPVTLSLKGGDRVKRMLANTARRLGAGGVLNVGFLAKATYPNGLNVAQNAFWQNFGTKRMPARPFFTAAVEEHSPEWPGQMAKIAKATGYDSDKTLGLMGELIKGQVVASIVAWSEPPLAPSTVERKGFDKPLIDSGVMQRSVDYEVVKL